MSNAEMGNLVFQVDVDGRSVEDVVAEWMNANKSTWQSWIK